MKSDLLCGVKGEASENTAARAVTVITPAEEMWKFKRENQRRDIEALRTGVISSDEVNWFAGGVARGAEFVDHELGKPRPTGRGQERRVP